MLIKRIEVGGFANLDRFQLELSKFNALVALNNYGKSNAIFALDFAIDFIKANTAKKDNMMAYMPYIPTNIHNDKLPYHFEIEFETGLKKDIQTVLYAFSFDWIKNKKKDGKIIRSESLKVKSAKEAKFKTYILREFEKATYLPSPSGRCDRTVKIKSDELVINKLLNFDDLFYLSILAEINEISILNVNTLEHPDKLFRRIAQDVVKTEYSVKVPEEFDVAFFIYSLEKLKSPFYNIFRDAVMTLLPCLEDFEPVEIDMKAISSRKKVNVPLEFPEKIYDIQVKERNCNQYTAIDRLSSGSQKLFYVLAMAIAAEINKVPLITFEELENSIHPGLLQKLLQILSGILENTKIMITSHSPYLLQYLDAEQISIGMPNKKGLATFRKIKKSKLKKITDIAQQEGMSFGDFIFDQMIDSAMGESEVLNELCD
ncbi:ATP-binding protein [Pedobacter chinensis]|uniref:ATP-binding protein n=1 Tax=Pedobacter chinensis TaxID=2282421 RepID=A0A369PPX0_9SPHI|nr:AAA family ATPase [Pedobacter chinensis]RDC54340.1 ATP-binding protein [Pedobacter chinensis]